MPAKQKKSTRVRSAVTGRFVDKNVSPETQEARKATTITETVKPYGKKVKNTRQESGAEAFTPDSEEIQSEEPAGESPIQEEVKTQTYPTMTDITNPIEEDKDYIPMGGIKNPIQE